MTMQSTVPRIVFSLSAVYRALASAIERAERGAVMPLTNASEAWKRVGRIVTTSCKNSQPVKIETTVAEMRTPLSEKGSSVIEKLLLEGCSKC
jgi:hypothetical protein